ncbi:helix-turn-helix transcriptional regulator [Kineococcus sp. NUM-3379]
MRARRAAASADDLGVPSYGVRRVPGLRRDEVAALAGVSIDYYTRLEQGRERRPSPQVLDALAHALDLTLDERRYAYALAGAAWTPPLPATRAPVDPSVDRLVASWPGAACFLLDPVLDVLRTNALADRLFSPFRSTENLAEMVFLDPAGREFFVDWEHAAANTVASLRATAGVHVGAARREELLARLTAGSPRFAELWAAHEVRPKTHDAKELSHPEVGPLTVAFDALEVAAMPGHQLVVYLAEPADTGGQRLRALAEGGPVPVEDAAPRA